MSRRATATLLAGALSLGVAVAGTAAWARRPGASVVVAEELPVLGAPGTIGHVLLNGSTRTYVPAQSPCLRCGLMTERPVTVCARGGREVFAGCLDCLAEALESVAPVRSR